MIKKILGGNPEDLPEMDGSDQWGNLQDVYTCERDHMLINVDEVEKAEGEVTVS